MNQSNILYFIDLYQNVAKYFSAANGTKNILSGKQRAQFLLMEMFLLFTLILAFITDFKNGNYERMNMITLACDIFTNITTLLTAMYCIYSLSLKNRSEYLILLDNFIKIDEHLKLDKNSMKKPRRKFRNYFVVSTFALMIASASDTVTWFYMINMKFKFVILHQYLCGVLLHLTYVNFCVHIWLTEVRFKCLIRQILMLSQKAVIKNVNFSCNMNNMLKEFQEIKEEKVNFLPNKDLKSFQSYISDYKSSTDYKSDHNLNEILKMKCVLDRLIDNVYLLNVIFGKQVSI